MTEKKKDEKACLSGSALIEEISRVVRQCGEWMLKADRTKAHTQTKEGHGNFVTVYDKQNQEYCREEFRKILPEAVFVGEEEDIHAQIKNGLAFIVDPIDGTANFIRDYKESCVSVALLRDAKPWLGVVYNPYLDELFTAERGHGAFLNGAPIRVSGNTIENALVLFGTTPYDTGLADKTFDIAKKLFIASTDIRRSGSAALDICDVACGRADLFFELRLSPWDHAAASVILTEAGGKLTQCDLSPEVFNVPCSVFARGEGIRDTDLPY
ncbi:MAG: inositol monophosphatase [Lachnospiraceae bacterium]|nr:inositol monophosphatase [Lachnospiraceae bacterium]